MRKIMIVLLSLSSLSYLSGQDKMWIDMPYSGNTHYGEFAKQVESISELPTVIQFNLNGYIERILGNMRDSVTFSHGQMVDLERFFKVDSVIYNFGWIVPKYDLHFTLKNKSVGIIKYYLQIRMDEYGQIVYCNYPKEKHSDFTRFNNRAEIEKFALRQAELKGFETTNYEVDFKYNPQLDILCWVFKFPIKSAESIQDYHVFEIPWNEIAIIKEYFLSISRTH